MRTIRQSTYNLACSALDGRAEALDLEAKEHHTESIVEAISKSRSAVLKAKEDFKSLVQASEHSAGVKVDITFKQISDANATSTNGYTLLNDLRGDHALDVYAQVRSNFLTMHRFEGILVDAALSSHEALAKTDRFVISLYVDSLLSFADQQPKHFDFTPVLIEVGTKILQFSATFIGVPPEPARIGSELISVIPSVLEGVRNYQQQRKLANDFLGYFDVLRHSFNEWSCAVKAQIIAFENANQQLLQFSSEQ